MLFEYSSLIIPSDGKNMKIEKYTIETKKEKRLDS
jgi:hypothetical protein